MLDPQAQVDIVVTGLQGRLVKASGLQELVTGDHHPIDSNGAKVLYEPQSPHVSGTISVIMVKGTADDSYGIQ
jgi:hypothetical protein